MRKPFETLMVKTAYLMMGIGLTVGCSSNSNDKISRPDEENPVGRPDTTGTDNPGDTFAPTLFTVIGDVPYNDRARAELITLIDSHNAKSESEFVVHVGDIKSGGDPCVENIYEDVSNILQEFEEPVFIVLGDNEYNDCDNPEDALALWRKYFLNFNGNWNFPHSVENQPERLENFAWVENGTLFMGLNLVGSSVHDQAEWNQRLTDDADWVERQFELHGATIEAAVFFWHANVTEAGPEKFEAFTDRFRASANAFGKPVLYLQGDGHIYFKNRPWPENNILRVQIEAGAHAVQVTVHADLEEPFAFDREFLD